MLWLIVVGFVVIVAVIVAVNFCKYKFSRNLEKSNKSAFI